MRPLTDIFFSLTRYKIAMFRVVGNVNRLSFAFARKNALNTVLDFIKVKGWVGKYDYKLFISIGM